MSDPHDLVEKLAAIEHERWSDWQRWCHQCGTRNRDGSITLPANTVARWERQIATPYDDLSENEKESDRVQVRRYLPLVTPDSGDAPPPPTAVERAAYGVIATWGWIRCDARNDRPVREMRGGSEMDAAYDDLYAAIGHDRVGEIRDWEEANG